MKPKSEKKIKGMVRPVTINNPPRDLICFAEGYLRSQGINASTTSWHPLSQDGSDRTFYRLTFDGRSLIAMINEHPSSNEAGVSENDSFYYLALHLRAKGIGTPEIYAFERTKGWFLVEDLGRVHLQDEARRIARDTVKLKELYQGVLDLLPFIQVKGAEGFIPARTHNPSYDSHFARQWESAYFFNAFLKGYLHLDISEDYLDEEFDDLAAHLSSAEGNYFLYRDFQSKNIMIKDQKLRFLDFQGARPGPLPYDLASLLLDPYVNLEDSLQELLLEYYLAQLRHYIAVNREKFLADYPLFALHRTMQILGAFGYLTTIKKKRHFVRYIPVAIKNLQKLLNLAIFSPYRNLKKVVADL